MEPNKVTAYVRFQHDGGISYGIRKADVVKEIQGDIFCGGVLTGRSFARSEIKILVPCEPSKVIAVGLNYASHRVHVEKEEGVFLTVAGKPAPQDQPVVFAKFPTSLIPDGEDIVFPADATNVHFEGELTLVVGKKAKSVSAYDARDYVFGVSIGNDLVDREWLLGDLQWFRAKGADNFGPMGPAIVTGLDYNNLKLVGACVNWPARESDTALKRS